MGKIFGYADDTTVLVHEKIDVCDKMHEKLLSTIDWLKANIIYKTTYMLFFFQANVITTIKLWTIQI